MNFINETMHPLTRSLMARIAVCYEAYDQGGADPTFYNVLEEWRLAQGWGDEKVADLYARLEETLGKYSGVRDDTASNIISKALWQNERIYP